jgi:hypothetical protein
MFNFFVVVAIFNAFVVVDVAVCWLIVSKVVLVVGVVCCCQCFFTVAGVTDR